MPDTRFFDALGPVSLGELAGISGATLEDASAGSRMVDSVAPLNMADARMVSFLGDKRYLPDLRATAAAACFVRPDMAQHMPAGCVRLVTHEPAAAYTRAANRLHQPIMHSYEAPSIHPEAEFEADVHLAPGVVIGQGAKIGAGTVIGANTVIGPGVAIGRDCRIGANVTIGFSLIGDRVYILPGAAIGQAGFGVAASVGGSIDFPQLGRVILQDEVTVGACTCIDRGAYSDTVVGQFTKIDNLVQIAHNVVIGRNCALAAQTGLSGSVTVGDNVQFGGKAGVGDHLTLHDNTRLAAGALAMRDIPAGETQCGVPARPIRRFMRELAWVSQTMDKDKGKRGGNKDGDG